MARFQYNILPIKFIEIFPTIWLIQLPFSFLFYRCMQDVLVITIHAVQQIDPRVNHQIAPPWLEVLTLIKVYNVWSLTAFFN